MKLSPLPLVSLEPPDVMTCTSTTPADVIDGDVTVIDVAETTVAAIAASPSNLTVAPVMNPVPVMVTLVPPTVLPVAGDSEVTVGVTVVNS